MTHASLQVLEVIVLDATATCSCVSHLRVSSFISASQNEHPPRRIQLRIPHGSALPVSNTGKLLPAGKFPVPSVAAIGDGRARLQHESSNGN